MAETSPALMRIVAAFSLLAAVMGPVLIYLGFAAQGLGALSRLGGGVGRMLAGATLGLFGLARGLFTVRGLLIGGVVAGLVALGRSVAGNIDNTNRLAYAWSAGTRMIGTAWSWLLATVEGDAEAQASALYVLGVQWDNFARLASELSRDVGMALLESVVGHENAQRAAENLGTIWGNLSDFAVGLWQGISNFADALRHDLSEAFQIFADDADSAQDGIAGLIAWYAQLSESLPDAEQVTAWMRSFAEGFNGVLIPAINAAHTAIEGLLALLDGIRDGLSAVGTFFGGEGNGFSEWLDGLDSGRVAGAAAAILLLLGPLRRVLGVGRAIIRVFASIATPLRIAAGWGSTLITGLGAIASAGSAASAALRGIPSLISRIAGPIGTLAAGFEGLQRFYEWGRERSNARPHAQPGNENMNFSAGEGLGGYRETIPGHVLHQLETFTDEMLLPGFLTRHVPLPVRPGGVVDPMSFETISGFGGRSINLEALISEIANREPTAQLEGSAEVTVTIRSDGSIVSTASDSGNIDVNVGVSDIPLMP